MGFFTGCEPLGGGLNRPPPSLKDNEWSDKKHKLSIFSRGNVEQICILAYPLKNYSYYPQSTLEHKCQRTKRVFPQNLNSICWAVSRKFEKNRNRDNPIALEEGFRIFDISSRLRLAKKSTAS